MAPANKKAPAQKKKAPAARKATSEVKTPAKKLKVPTVKKASNQATSKKPLKTKSKAKPSKNRSLPTEKAVAKKLEKKVVSANRSVAINKSVPSAVPAGERFRGLKSMLISKRDSLLSEAKLEIQKYVSGENRQLVDTAIDEADWAAVEISEDLNLKRLSAHRQLLNDVEECLRKVNEGTYGICEDCGEEISEKRLRVIPTATLCIDCKEQREKMAILEQETDI